MERHWFSGKPSFFIAFLFFKLFRGYELLEKVAHKTLLQTDFNCAFLEYSLKIGISFIVREELVRPCDILETAIGQNQIFSRSKVIVRPVLDSFNIEKFVYNFGGLGCPTNHEKYRHHHSHLVPEECRALDHTLVDRKLWTLFILLNELSAERKYSSHEVLLFLIIILLSNSQYYTIVFLTEIAKIV